MALFYAGVAFQLFQNPLTSLQQLFMAQTATPWTTLWTADRWAMLALGFAALGVACALLQLDEIPQLRRPRPSMQRPAQRPALPKRATPTVSFPRISLPNFSLSRLWRPQRQSPRNPATTPRYTATTISPGSASPSVSPQHSQPLQYRWRRFVAAGLGIGLTVFLWWGVGRIQFADLLNTGSLPSAQLDNGGTGFPTERASPTPTADTSSPALSVLASEISVPELPPNAPVVIATDTPAVLTGEINTDSSPQANKPPPASEAQPAPAIPETASVQAQSAPPTAAAPVAEIAPAEPPLAAPLDVVIPEAAGVNVRAEPGLSAQILTALVQGTRIPAIGRTLDNQWIRVRLDDGREAWVAAFVVELTGDLATLPLINAVNLDATVAAVPETAPANGTVAAADTGEIQAAAVAPRTSSSLGSTSYTVDLLAPSEGAAGNGLISFLWEANFVPAENQGLEVLFWKPSESALETGIRIAAPTSRGNAVVNLTDLNAAVNGAIAYGPYRWGIFLIQQSPYRRLALLSKERTFIFEQD